MPGAPARLPLAGSGASAMRLPPASEVCVATLFVAPRADAGVAADVAWVVAACPPLAGNGASATRIHCGITSFVDAACAKFPAIKVPAPATTAAAPRNQ
jgi:hypothetical protein